MARRRQPDPASPTFSLCLSSLAKRNRFLLRQEHTWKRNTYSEGHALRVRVCVTVRIITGTACAQAHIHERSLARGTRSVVTALMTARGSHLGMCAFYFILFFFHTQHLNASRRAWCHLWLFKSAADRFVFMCLFVFRLRFM